MRSRQGSRQEKTTYTPSGSIPCSSETTSQNLAPEQATKMRLGQVAKSPAKEEKPTNLVAALEEGTRDQSICHGSANEAIKKTNLAGLKMDDFTHSTIQRREQLSVRRLVRGETRDCGAFALDLGHDQGEKEAVEKERECLQSIERTGRTLAALCMMGVGLNTYIESGWSGGSREVEGRFQFNTALAGWATAGVLNPHHLLSPKASLFLHTGMSSMLLLDLSPSSQSYRHH